MTSDEAVWRGEGWQVRIDSDGSLRGGAVRVRQEQARPGASVSGAMDAAAQLQPVTAYRRTERRGN